MRERWLIALTAVLVSAAAWGQTMPAASAAEKPAADEDKGVPAALIKAAEDSFVKVRFHFKKDLAEEAGRKSWAAFRARYYVRMVDDKMTLDAVGVAIGRDEVMIYDNGLEDRFIERIEVETFAGKTHPAKRHRMLSRAPIETLKLDAKVLKPLRFVEAGKITTATSLRTAGLVRKGDRWRTTYGSVSPSLLFDPAWRGVPVFIAPGERPKAGHYDVADTSGMNAIHIVANDDGKPVGVVADDMFDAEQRMGLWIGNDLKSAAGLTAAELAKRRVKLREDLLKAVHEVKVKFRQGSGRDSSPLAGREISFRCMAISPTRAIIPSLFDRKSAAKIEKIQIKYNDDRRVLCRFLGVYKDFGATLIELTKTKFPGHVAAAKTDLKRLVPFWVVRPREKNGRTDVDLTLNRLMEKRRGYRDVHHWVTARVIPSGTFVVDMDGKLAGVQMVERVEDEEQRQLAESADRYGGTGGPTRRRLFTIGELRQALAEPTAAFDPQIRVMSKRLAKRRQWFGVEYVGLNRDLSEQLKVEKQTKDGTVGFLVSAVYDDSPAQKMGVAVGDILLDLRVEGKPYPIELKSQLASSRSGGSWRDGSAKTWKDRDNFMTKVLDAIGAGKKVAVTYYDADAEGGKTVTRPFVVERAPEDFDSAARWKNRKVGLTVKDLTYEVRKALNLPADAPGVVVAKIEPGSPARIARVRTHELITRCDGKPVTSAKQLRDIVAACKGVKDKVRLTVLRLGKTRFADLAVKEYDSADDEGLDEE